MRFLSVGSVLAALVLAACGAEPSMFEGGAAEWAVDAEALTVLGVAPAGVPAAPRGNCVGDKQGRGCDPTAAIAPVPGISGPPASPTVAGDSSPDPIPAINPDRMSDDRRPVRGDCDRPDGSGGRKGCFTKSGRSAP
jgi:hypothetical protein